MKELLRKHKICEKKIELLRKYYKRRDENLKKILGIMFDKGKYTDKDKSWNIKVGKELVKVRPNWFNSKDELIVTNFTSAGIPTFILTINKK